MASSSSAPQVITCKEALVMEEVEISPPQPLEIRIKTIFPRIFGHEASGVVESVGQGVTEFKEGDHVLTVFLGECMSCKMCKSGKSTICQVLGFERKGLMHSDQKTRFMFKGKPVYHYCAVSSFSEYTVVHSGCAVKISPHVPLEKVCLLSCGVAAGIGAAWNVADVSKGSTVVIFGLGTVGLSVAQGAKLRGASRIIGVDNNPRKCENGTIISSPSYSEFIFQHVTWSLDFTMLVSTTAKAFGITEVVDPNSCQKPIAQVIKGITDGGADFCFECVGDSDMLTTALESCCDGWGVTVALGVPRLKPKMSAHYSLFLKGRTLKGSIFGGWKPKSDLPSLVEKYMNKEIQIDDYITHNLPFDDINKAFNLMTEGKCLRCVIHIPR
ncbi:hypothetical protein TSUD_54690 [Trifolium subterraneum]|uniref:Enoyl reductase (ER) domain-containing protein n=1 Tax=Trifolium subterraneum TaxID=3900 RepID=A0A2Z6NFR9_TRISU|nr:hypothetical protein TSUD_54690 [Trifolium subterraneum]